MKGRLSQLTLTLVVIVILILATSSMCFAVSKCADGEHQFVVTVEKYATANEDGIRQFKCDICGYTYTEAIPATGHKYKKHEIAPTCTESGKIVYKCTECGDVYTENYGQALGHNYEVVSKTEATCLKEGKVTYVCSRCGNTYSESTSEPTGHKWGKWIVDKEATIKEEGLKHRICENDASHREEKSIPMLKDEHNEQGDLNESKPVSKPVPFSTVDAVIIGADGISLAFFAVLLIPYFKVIIWIGKKKKEKEEEANDN